MTKEMMNEAKVFYNNLSEYNKLNVKFQIYINCKSMDENDENCMIWFKIPLNEFIKEFDIES